MATLFMRSKDGQVHPIELKRGVNRIGHDPSNDHRVDDPTVSAHHCELLVTQKSVRVRDLGSTNGTFVDDQAVKEAELKGGQILRLGLVEMGLDAPPFRIAIPPMESPSLPEPVYLSDGTPACLNHPDVTATRSCTHCGLFFCSECVRELRRVGGELMLFCNSCGAQCEILEPRPEAHGGKWQWLNAITREVGKTFKALKSSRHRHRRRRRRF